MFCDVFLRFVMFTFRNYYVLKLLRLETITFSDDTLKVHKIKNFFDSDFGICVISLLVM
jgi:hypothetical protein